MDILKETKEVLKAELTKLGIEFKAKAKVGELRELLANALREPVTEEKAKPKRNGAYDNFDELKSALGTNPANTLTAAVDKLLLVGDTLEDILAKIERRKAADFPESKDFKTVAVIKRHIAYRQSKGWIFETDKEARVRLIDYKKMHV